MVKHLRPKPGLPAPAPGSRHAAPRKRVRDGAATARDGAHRLPLSLADGPSRPPRPSGSRGTESTPIGVPFVGAGCQASVPAFAVGDPVPVRPVGPSGGHGVRGGALSLRVSPPSDGVGCPLPPRAGHPPSAPVPHLPSPSSWTEGGPHAEQTRTRETGSKVAPMANQPSRFPHPLSQRPRLLPREAVRGKGGGARQRDAVTNGSVGCVRPAPQSAC